MGYMVSLGRCWSVSEGPCKNLMGTLDSGALSVKLIVKGQNDGNVSVHC